jgi:hypothetical protein
MHLPSVLWYYPGGKYEYLRLPMRLYNSPDIFQEKMSELMFGLEFARPCLDDLLVVLKDTFESHLKIGKCRIENQCLKKPFLL